MRESDVKEFVVIPPEEQIESLLRSRERFVDYMTRRFPAYMFRVAPFVPIGDAEEFSILPIMNYVGDDGGSYACNPPCRWVMSEIAQACREFDEEGVRSSAT